VGNGTMKALLLAVSAIGLLGAAAAAAAQAPKAGAPATSRITVPALKFGERRLPNGLRVISMRDTTTPNVSVSVWYEVGSKHDPEGRSGFAHLFEHILSRKTRNMPYNMINGLVEDIGGTRNASTGFDRTNYYEIVPARLLETMLWTHAERMARPVIDPQVFESERNVVKEEFRQNVLAPPYGQLRLLVTENSWDKLPHRRPGIGSIAQLDAARIEDARAFHEAYYGPDTATLIVSGNFDQKQLDAWVDRLFAPIPARSRKVPLAIPERDAPRTAPRTATMYVPNVPLPVVGTTWRVPGFSHPDTAAIQVMDQILTGGESSRLYKALVDGKQVATQVSGQLGSVEEEGFYAPTVILAGGRNVAEAEAALATEIAAVRDRPVTAAELAEAKNEIFADALRQRETFSGRASGLGEALVRSGDAKAWDKRLGEIQKVTIADVQRVARKYLTPQSRVDLRYLNDKEKPQGTSDTAWMNPVAMPRFKSVPAAVKPAIEHASDAEREKAPAPGAPVAVTLPTIAETKLATGLNVITARTGDVPLATMTLVVKGGSSTDPAGRAGTASFVADLATKGTPTRTAGQIAEQLESLGAEISSGAGADGSVLSVSAPVANLDAAAAILADIAQNATFPAQELEMHRKRSLDLLSVAMRNPGAIAAMIAQPLVYGASPYGGITSATSLKSLARDDLAAHHKSWWHPGNASLIVTGGIDPARANALAARLFGGWRGQGPAPQLPQSRAGEAQKARTVVIDMPTAGQAAVGVAVRAIGRGDPDYYNLSVANAVLGAGSTGRLFQEVRTKRALSYGSYSNLPARADASVLSATAQTKNESAAEVVQVILAELDRLGKEPLDQASVERRIAFLTGGYNRQMETSGGVGSVLASLIQQGLTPAEATRFVAQMEGVSPAQATAVAGRLVSADRATLVVVGDASKFLDKLKAVRPNVEVIPLAELDLDSPTLRRKK
jgi:zinc protease